MKIVLAVVISIGVTLATPIMANPSVNKEQALKAHNSLRARDGQQPIQWSSDLENISQKWADQLASDCKVYHHQGELPFGENLFISSSTTTVGQAISTWGNEKESYNYSQNSCEPNKQCGHYTQVVWKGTTDVGCAKQACSNGSEIVVCSYFPAGNVVGARPY